MEKVRTDFIGYAILAVILAVIFAVLFRFTQNQDIAFVRQTLSGLVAGNQSAENSIDWRALQALDNDIGKQYRELMLENERSYFRKAFILNFSLAFKNSGGKLSALRNWRLYSRNQKNIVVAADGLAKKTLLFTVSRLAGKPRLISMQFQ